MTKVSLSPIILILQLALVSCVGAQSNPLIHYEFEGDYSNSGTGIVAGQPRGGATIVADPGGGLTGASNVLKLYGNDEYVKIGNDDVGSITTALTVAAWVKSDGTNWSDAGIVTRGYNWRLYISGSANGTIQCMDTEPQGSKARGSVNINEGEWHHVAGTYDGTQYILYIDGVQDGPAVPATGPIAQTTSHKFTIGAFESSGNVSKFYDGYIDDVRVYDEALDSMAIQGLVEGDGVTIHVDPNGDIAAANAIAEAGDIIDIAAGTYVITTAIEIKDGVTYQGAGAGLTVIDGGNLTRAFVAWGDRGATDGQVDVNGVGVPNATGPTGWVLDGMTIQNCVSDTENRQNILSAARDLLDNYPGAAYTLATAQEENGGITDNPGWFDILSGGADANLNDVELQAYLDANPVGSAGHLVVNDDKRDDGGAVCILNGAEGTIQNCTFSNNVADDDGGAIMVAGDALDVAIDNCTFNLNSCGDDGGAVRLAADDSNYTITGCSFTDSACGDDGGAIQMAGAGDAGSIYTVTDTTFTGCNAVGDDGDGGAIQVSGDNSSYVWAECTFTGCYASDDGGAFKYGPNQAELTMTNCAFIGNGIDPSGTVVTQRNVWQCNDEDAGPLTIINCLFADNATADDRLVEVKGGATILNCTFVNNVVGDKPLLVTRGRPWDSTGDGVDDVTTDDSVINNCLFINNTMLSDSYVIGDTRNDDFAATVTNCLFFGNLDGLNPAINTNDASPEVGTIDVSAVTDAAQLVVNPAAGGDYRLVAGSAAIDAANPATATDTDIEGTAAWGLRDVGVYEFVGGKYVVDNFENYHAQTFDDPGAVFNVWVDGYADEKNGSMVGNEFLPYPEQVIVHGGRQAMPFFYDNTGDAMYSEATQTFGQPRDWSQTGFDGVALFFKGVPENTLGQLYMKTNDTKVLYTDGDANLQSGLWHLWYVPFANLAGVDLTNVQTLTIGVESGGKGVLYIDDIELDNP